MCQVTAENYFAKTDECVKERLHVLPKDMFRDCWPNNDNYDANLFSNILHDYDWSFETCKELLQKSFDALPSGPDLEKVRH